VVALVATLLNPFGGRKQIKELAPSAVADHHITLAARLVEIGTAFGAYSLAVRATNGFHWDIKRGVLAHGVAKVKEMVLVDSEALSGFVQPFSTVEADGLPKREGLFLDGKVDGVAEFLQAPAAFDPGVCFQRRTNPDALVGPQQPYGTAYPPRPGALRVKEFLFKLVDARGAAGLLQQLRHIKKHPITTRAL
jgi:hypothetical protein